MTAPNLIDQVKEVLKNSTSGPWVAEFYAHHTKIACAGGFVIEDYGYEGLALARFNDAEDKANLHLMALAPDMARHILAQEEQLKAAEKLAGKYVLMLEEYMDELHDNRDGVWAQSDFDKIEEEFRPALTAYRATGGSDDHSAD